MCCCTHVGCGVCAQRCGVWLTLLVCMAYSLHFAAQMVKSICMCWSHLTVFPCERPCQEICMPCQEPSMPCEALKAVGSLPRCPCLHFIICICSLVGPLPAGNPEAGFSHHCIPQSTSIIRSSAGCKHPQFVANRRVAPFHGLQIGCCA